MRKLAAVLAALLITAGIAAIALGDGTSPSFTFSTDEAGATFQCALDNASASSCSGSQTYGNLAPGQHTVTITSTFTVPNPAPKPVAAFTIAPNPAVANQATTFDSKPSTCAAPCSYKWTDPGDGQVYSTASSFSFTFHSLGAHQVALAITDGSGLTASSTQTFQVQSAAPPPPPPPNGSNCAPAKNQTMTNTVSSTCGFADTTNTGVPAGTTLVNVPGDITAPKADGSTGQGWTWNGSWITVNAGGVLKNVKVAGHVNLSGNGATVEDSEVISSGSNSYGITSIGGSNQVADHNTVHGTGSAIGQPIENCIYDVYGNATNWTVTNNNVYWCASGFNNIHNGGVIRQNYVHDLALTDSGSHVNGMQFQVGDGTPTTVKDNTIFNPISQTDCIILSNDSGGTETNRQITHNLLAGGGYTFYGNHSTSVTFTNNDFARIYYSTSGYYGPDTGWLSGSGNTWSGNIWDDTGASLQP